MISDLSNIHFSFVGFCACVARAAARRPQPSRGRQTHGVFWRRARTGGDHGRLRRSLDWRAAQRAVWRDVRLFSLVGAGDGVREAPFEAAERHAYRRVSRADAGAGFVPARRGYAAVQRPSGRSDPFREPPDGDRHRSRPARRRGRRRGVPALPPLQRPAARQPEPSSRHRARDQFRLISNTGLRSC